MPLAPGLVNGFRVTGAALENGFAKNPWVGKAALGARAVGRAAKSVAGLATDIAVRAPAKAITGSFKAVGAYDNILNKMVTRNKNGVVNDAKIVGGMALVGAPIALAGKAVVDAGTPDYKSRLDYGTWANQNAMTGTLDVAEMGSYDVDRATESARRIGLVKTNGFEGNYWACSMEKNAGVADKIIGWGINGVNKFKTFGKVVKDPRAYGHVPKSFGDNKLKMLGVGLGFGGLAAAGEYGASLRVSRQNVNTYMNLPSQVPQL